MAPALERFDHVHVFVADRAAAERWYAEVLGFVRVPELAFWSAGGGPLTLANADGGIHLALFEGAPQPNRATIAFGTGAAQFLVWRRHLRERLGRAPRLDDHTLCYSMYFADPDGNPYEITCDAHAALKGALENEPA